MVYVFVNCLSTTIVLEADNVPHLHQKITMMSITQDKEFILTNQGGLPIEDMVEFDTVIVNSILHGGIDFQHREGSKIGSGGVSSAAQAAIERRERLRKLALETIDITKDPYIMKNHLGTYECKLCLTLHPNEGNYLAHTQGKRHQSNLGRRAAMEAKTSGPKILPASEPVKKRVIKIGRPGYKVSDSRPLFSFHRHPVTPPALCR